MIRAAQRRHHRLLRRYGEHATSHAVRVAVEIWNYLNAPRFLRPYQWQRAHVLRPGTVEVSQHEPLAHAVCYPEIITIAGVIASPHWQPQTSGATHPAHTEIHRRLATLAEQHYGFSPPKRHPLTDWSESHRYEQRLRGIRLRRTSTGTTYFETPAQPWSQ
ncbi:hypothetical protein LWC33_10800 [Pseudonocardia sp. RS11V-5]|uniref:hypothetical protein n=1 Tax=Pseudonocardia terrae TaxID=2905831 RepID=UPI001E508DF2|nr:hypothetical protein [Pseudonocardia terrae]MCE3551946.1 hypothetical protein [Pseudonocardia terrae]